MKFLTGVLITFFLIFGGFQVLEAGQQTPTVLIYNTLEKDPVYGNPEFGEYFLMKKLLRLFPQAAPTVVRGNDESELRPRLAQSVSSVSPIDALVILSHGDAEPQTGESVIYNSLGFEVHPENPKSVEWYFRPVVGRFSKNAKIVFTGCKLLAGHSAQDLRGILSRMIRVAEAFQFRSGTLYMNRTEGTPILDSILRQPFHKQPGLKAKLKAAFYQVSAVVSYPVALIYSVFIRNQGYTLRVSEGIHGGLFYELFRENMMFAQKRHVPTGTPLATEWRIDGKGTN